MAENDKQNEAIQGRPAVPAELPILSPNLVLFPDIIMPLSIEDPKNVAMINETLSGNKLIGLFVEKKGKKEKPEKKSSFIPSEQWPLF